ncbi:MAG: polymer-forming cytoskeletal protein [Pseudomonadales bacterium]
MSILDQLKDPQPESRAPGRRPRMPEAISAAREIARIGETITIRGDVVGAESLVIDCRVEGSIALAENDLTIGQSGSVSAGATAKLVRVEGEVTGDIVGTEKVVVTRTGRVFGNIVAPRVTLEDGAMFKGFIDMDPGPDQPPVSAEAPRPVPAESPAGAADKSGGGKSPD